MNVRTGGVCGGNQDSEQFAATLKRDREKWAAIVKRLGIKVEQSGPPAVRGSDLSGIT